MAKFTPVLPGLLFFLVLCLSLLLLLLFILFASVFSSHRCFPRSSPQPPRPRSNRPTLQFPWKQPNSRIPSSLRPSPSRAPRSGGPSICAMCHGKDGDAKGETATEMKRKIVDFTDPATPRTVPMARSSTLSRTATRICLPKAIASRSQRTGTR